ncbi:MAG: hypothetical protein IKF82_00405 [Bacilli bacterium]|nr:hypothetical protein [Bacilli bacterium]
MNFCIDKMTQGEIDLMNEQSRLASPVFRSAKLIFGGCRHQSAAFYGVEPKIGEECYIERRWRSKDGSQRAQFAGKEGSVNLINKDELSYGILLQGEKKLKQLEMLGIENVKTNKDIKENDEYFNPNKKFVITDIVRDNDTIHFVSVEMI